MREAYVYIHLAGTFVPAGILSVENEGRRDAFARFSYGRKYLERPDAAAIDPVQLPLGRVEYRTAPGVPLFGGIRDAAPDAWGQHLLQTAFPDHALLEFDFLTLAADDRIGALGFGPDLSGPGRARFGQDLASDFPGEVLNLEALAEAAERVENEEELDIRLRRFLVRGSSFGGARPKAPAELNGQHWLAKFDRKGEAWATNRIEYATMTLARKAGINTPEVQIVRVGGKKKRDVYLIERFDRAQDQGHPIRRHFVSALTMLGLHEGNADGRSYHEIAEVLRQHGSSGDISADTRQLYRRMVFNALCHNTDDHLRNHGFLWDGKGWRLSPAYDIVPQPVVESAPRMLTLRIGPDQSTPTKEAFLAVAPYFALSTGEARDLLREIQAATAGWVEHFKSCGVVAKDLEQLRECFRSV